MAYQHINRYNFPANSTIKNVYYTLNNINDYISYIGSNPDRIQLYMNNNIIKENQLANKIFIDPSDQTEFNIDNEYLSTSIDNKKVYAPLIGCGYYLYTGPMFKYIVLDLNDNFDQTSTSIKFVEVRFTKEKTLSELYSHPWWYNYDFHTNCFLELPDQGKLDNLMRYSIQCVLLRIVGTAEDRLADYGRVIAFLLSKVELTEEEKLILQPFIDQTPDINTLATISDKEKEIRRLVYLAHTNPVQFLEENYGNLNT